MTHSRSAIGDVVAVLVAGAATNNRTERDAAICLERAHGVTLRELALRFSISRAQVRRIVTREAVRSTRATRDDGDPT